MVRDRCIYYNTKTCVYSKSMPKIKTAPKIFLKAALHNTTRKTIYLTILILLTSFVEPASRV